MCIHLFSCFVHYIQEFIFLLPSMNPKSSLLSSSFFFLSPEKIFMWTCDIKFIYCFRQQTHPHFNAGYATSATAQKKPTIWMRDCWNKSNDANEKRASTMLMNLRKFSAAFSSTIQEKYRSHFILGWFEILFIQNGCSLFVVWLFLALLLLCEHRRTYIPFAWSVYVRNEAINLEPL